MPYYIVVIFMLIISGCLKETRSESDCPPFKVLDRSTSKCVCSNHSSPRGFICEKQLLPIGWCMTFDESTGITSAGHCPYNLDLTGNISLSTNRLKLRVLASTGQELNAAMCEPLNREGLLCGKCKPNYGPSIYSDILQCVKCYDKYSAWMWVLYLTLETVPITLLYIAIILFNIRATSPPFTSFIFHCQLIAQISILSHYEPLLKYGSHQTLFKVTIAVLDIWNLDVLRHIVPPFCITSTLSNFSAQSIRLASNFYLLFLIIGSYSLIELHAMNCKLIVCLWKPFHKYFAYFRRNWDPESSNANAFSTVLLLFLLKVCFKATLLIYPITINNNHSKESQPVLYIDPYMNLNKEIHHILIPIIITAGTLFPTLILCLYPTKVMRKWFFCCRACCGQRFRMFIEIFQGPYKDGTNGMRDYRAVSGLVFFLRFVIGIYLALFTTSQVDDPRYIELLIMTYILVVISLFYAIAQPCKKNYMNVLESIQYALTGLSLQFLIVINLDWSHKAIGTKSLLVHLLMIVILLPSIILLVKITLKVISVLFLKLAPKGFLRWYKSNRNETFQDILPHRILKPNEYTPLTSAVY